MYDVITVGSVTVDAFVKTEFCKMIHSPKNVDCIAYPVGAKILIDDLLFTIGGGGTNTAVSLSRLGHKVAFIGKIGTRENSNRVLKLLNYEKVNTSLILRSKKNRTGFSVILDSKNRDRTILTYRGSNSNININEINLKKINTKWFYFSSMMKDSLKTLQKLSHYAKKHNIKIAFNISLYLAKRKNKTLSDILKRCTILILNKEEASVLVGKSTIKNMLLKLRKLGPEIVAITDARKGAFALHKDTFYRGMPTKIKIVETTGAGDAFASSFLSGIIKKNDVELAMQLGMTNAESVIQHHGAKEKLLTHNEAIKIMKKRPIKVIKKKI